MGCSSRTLAGLAQECVAGIAGVEQIWLVAHGDYVASIDEANHAISALTSEATTASTVFYGYVLPKNTASLASPFQIGDDGTVRYQNTIIMQFNRMTGRKHAEIQAIAQTPVDAIVLDKNKKYWFVGYDEALVPTDGNAETGTNSTSDRNGYTITLAAMSSYLPLEMTKDQFNSLNTQTPASE